MKLKDITISIFDGKHGDCKDKKGSGLYFISVKDIREYEIDYSNAREIEEQDFVTNYQRTKLEPGDTIYANTGDTIGKSIFVLDSPLVFKTSFQKSVAIIKPNKKFVLPRYLYYLLKYETPRLRRVSTGSGQKNLLLSTMREFNINIHSMDNQYKISYILGLIDDKIRLNNNINDNLQQLIQSVYGYWFNQFNFPNSKGLPYALSKGSFVYNESIKRKIPKDWNVETLKCNSISHFIETGIPYFKTKNYLATANVDNFDIKDGDWITYSNRESRANMTPSIYSIWFAKMKNSIKHISIPENGNWMVEKYVLSTGFSGIQCTKFSYAYLYCFINEPFFETTKDILSHGATQQSVNNDDLNSIKIIIPPLDVLKSFAKIANPIYEKICNIIHENQILAEQRDSLLPLLMNGQVTID